MNPTTGGSVALPRASGIYIMPGTENLSAGSGARGLGNLPSLHRWQILTEASLFYRVSYYFEQESQFLICWVAEPSVSQVSGNDVSSSQLNDYTGTRLEEQEESWK